MGASMGRQLTELAPSLRKLGYTAERRRTRQGNLWRLESLHEAGDWTQAM